MRNVKKYTYVRAIVTFDKICRNKLLLWFARLVTRRSQLEIVYNFDPGNIRFEHTHVEVDGNAEDAFYEGYHRLGKINFNHVRNIVVSTDYVIKNE